MRQRRPAHRSTRFLCLLVTVLALPAIAEQAPRRQFPVAEQLPQQVEAVISIAGPAIAVEAIDCLPLGGNGVVTARVTNEPPAARVQIHFRRVNAERPDFYYVNANATGDDIHEAVLPRPTFARSTDPLASRQELTPAQRREFQRSRKLEQAGVWARFSFEPVELRAVLIDHDGRELASSAAKLVAVSESCPGETTSS